MKLSEIKLTLFAIGTQIRVGLHRFDRIVVDAEKALGLVQDGKWEDSPAKAHYVSLSDDEKEHTDEPEGLGLLTCLPGFDHQAVIDAAAAAAKGAPPAKNTQQDIDPPAEPPKPAAPKTKGGAKGGAKSGAKPPKSAPPVKQEEAPKDAPQDEGDKGGEDTTGNGAEGDQNGDGKKE